MFSRAMRTGRTFKIPTGDLYKWDKDSTYIKEPPFFDNLKAKPDPVTDIKKARVLALFGDSITTDHISPAGTIGKSSPAGQYLPAKRRATQRLQLLRRSPR